MSQPAYVAVVLRVMDTHEALLHAMMAFECARHRHAVICERLHKSNSISLVIPHRIAISVEDAARADLIRAVDAWAATGGAGFEQLSARARAWESACVRLDTSTEHEDLEQASNAFDALVREAMAVAETVAAVN